MLVRGDRPEGLGQDHRGTAVQQPGRLRVAFDRHGRDGSVRAHLEDGDAHPLEEGSGVAEISGVGHGR